MYIFELIARALNKKPQKKSQDFDPLENAQEIQEECEHLFLPLDSSNEYFACKYCGLVVPKDKLKNKNIFASKNNKLVDFKNHNKK